MKCSYELWASQEERVLSRTKRGSKGELINVTKFSTSYHQVWKKLTNHKQAGKKLEASQSTLKEIQKILIQIWENLWRRYEEGSELERENSSSDSNLQPLPQFSFTSSTYAIVLHLSIYLSQESINQMNSVHQSFQISSYAFGISLNVLSESGRFLNEFWRTLN